MYRFVFFFALICFVAGDDQSVSDCRRRDSPCSGRPSLHHQEHKKDYHKRIFHEVAGELIAADRKVLNYCNKFSNGASKEIIEQDMYKIVIPIANVNANDVEIKVRHRVIYIQVHKDEPYTEIRIIPSVADARSANFVVNDGELVIQFPIKTKAGNGNNCEQTIDSEIINVPVSDN